MRIAITLAYNGTHFLGSQIQKETNNTIFGQVEQTLSKLGINYKVIASGRTDKGVHATGQVCHLDLPEFWSDLKKLKKVLNEMLPYTIRVKSIKVVESEFHARYSTKKRVYRYIIREGEINPFTNDFITFLKSVDFTQIEKNIKLFIGEQDFKQFFKTGSDTKSTNRIIYKAFAYKYRGYIILNFEANGFLRGQIRLMVGAILNLKEDEIKEQLACQKSYKIKPAPSSGLYLAKIKY
ncbi:MAG: tRNA pseudouridine(38-40) synthase TruA [Campylobacterota bacterium]|nr:tRNA pseudouridine(38-40) synthase TruA [Campylobacterota bacterium]